MRRADARPAPDLVERRFHAHEPDRLWVAAINDIPTWAGFQSLAVLIDACSRRVGGWAMVTHLRAELGLDALDMALGQRPRESVIYNSDQGTQYTSIAFGLRCREVGVHPSMGSVGDCYGNSVCESVFVTLECELLDHHRFRNQGEPRMAVFDFIEDRHNPHCRHSGLGYHSPMKFERGLGATD